MLHSLTILIIDSDVKTRQLIAVTLRREGFIVEEWEDVRDFDDIDDIGCSMVVVDVNLPKSKGANLIKDMRKHSVTMDLPIMICSAKSSDNDIINGLNAGADEYITKPISPAALLARVKSVMRRFYPYHAIG